MKLVLYLGEGKAQYRTATACLRKSVVSGKVGATVNKVTMARAEEDIAQMEKV